jgi:peptidoglycan/LPS O-acetylase OafA/YrhL
MPGVARTRRDEHGRLDHIPALDGLRGVAVAVVLWFHAGHLQGGYLGVDLFFTLSGYLITSLLVLEWRGTGGIALGAFWGRRVRRLLPALVVMLVLVGFVAHWHVLPAARGDLRDSGLATLGYVANWRAVFAGDGYWDQALTPSWLEHTWSLAIEEQIYLVWPLVALAVLGVARRRGAGRAGAPPGAEDPSTAPASRERRIRLLGTVALVGAALSGGLMIVGAVGGMSLERLYLGTDTRVAAILLGAALACFQRARGAPRPWPADRRPTLALAGAVAFGLLVVAWVTLPGTSPLLYRGGLLLCGVAATVVILDISTPGRSLVGIVLAVPVLRWLGAISYGLYLYHWPIYRYLGETDLGLSGWGLTFARVACSLAAAAASFYLLEQPILQRRWTWPSVRLAPVGIGLAVLALLFASIGAVDVAPATEEATRPDLADLGPRQAAARVAVPADEQAAGTVPEVRTEKLIDPVVLVVGDSVGFALAEEGLVPQQATLGLTTVNGAEVGCTLMREIGVVPPPGEALIRKCSDQWQPLLYEYRPDVVVFLFGAFGGLSATPVDGQSVYPCQEAYDERWRERVEEAVAMFESAGAVVDLVTSPSGLLLEGRATLDERQGCINEVLREVAADSPDASAIDLAEWVCPEGRCREDVDGARLRPDGLHFTGAGAEVVARWMAPQVTTVEVAT